MGNYWDPRTRKVMIREHGRAKFIFRIAPRSKSVSLVRFGSGLDQVFEIMHSFILLHANRLFSLRLLQVPHPRSIP